MSRKFREFIRRLFWRAPLAFACLALLAASPAVAQVAGTCGAGKACQVRSISVRGPGNPTSAVCLNPLGSYFWRIYSSANSMSLGYTASTAQCLSSAGVTPGLTLDPSQGTTTSYLSFASTGYVTANSGFCSGTTCTGVAYTSFPACSAGLAGRLLYDSTNAYWRVCNGTSWQALVTNPISALDGYCGGVGQTCNPFQAMTARLIGLAQIRGVTIVAAGAGAGTFDVELYDVTQAATLSSISGISCSTAVGSYSLNGSFGQFAASDVLTLTVTNNGCGSLPAFNAHAEIIYAP